MAEKRILLADADPQVLEEFRQALGQEWEVTPATTGPAVVAEMKKRPYEVVVVELDLPQMDGAEVLSKVRKKYPKTVRFVIANESSKDRVMKEVLGAHQFLAKPLNASTLRATIERAVALDAWIGSNSLRELVARVRTFPSLPTLYIEVLNALRSPNATTEDVGAIIAKDMAMMTKLLQVLNSAYFGLPRTITDPAEAVGLLGFETVKSMVMAIKLLSQYDKIKPVYFSIDRLWRHSTEVARIAKELTLMETGDRALADTAFTCGLMHDVGKVVLAANFDEQYRGVQSLAQKQKVPLSDVEKEIFGAGDGEIGAYLLGLWGMPLDLLEVAALHHSPIHSLDKSFTALTAVHVANVLDYEANPDASDAAVPVVDEEYLARTGLAGRIDARRTTISGVDLPKPAIAEAAQAPVAAEASTLETKVESPAQSPPEAEPIPAPPVSKPFWKPTKWTVPTWTTREWRYAGGAVATVLLLLVMGLVLRRPESPQIVRAKSLTNQPLSKAPPTVSAPVVPTKQASPPTAKTITPEKKGPPTGT